MKYFKSAGCLAFLVLFTVAMSTCVPPMNFVKGDVPAYNVLDYYTGSFEMYDPNLIDPFCDDDDLDPYPNGCHQGVSYYFDPPIFIDNFAGHDYFTIDQNVLLYENGDLKTPTSLYIDQELWNTVSDVLYTNPIHNRLTLKFSNDYLGHIQANAGLDIAVVVYNYYSYAEDGGGNPILGFAAPGNAPIRFKAWPEDSFSLPASNYPPYVLRHTPQSLTPRFPPHGRIKIDFSEGVNGAVYFDKPKPSDLRITDNNGIPIENQPLPMKIRATSVLGWEIATQYNFLLPSEYERLFYDMVDATLNPKDIVYPDLYSLRGHALQDTSGAPLYTTGTGTIAADDNEPLGIFYEYYPLPDPPTGTEARMPFDLRFTTARVKITSPLYLGRYTDFPGTITGICTNDVSQVRLTGLDDGTPLDVTVDCIAGSFTYSSVAEPSTEHFYELRATVSGTTDDFDVIGVSKVSLSDQPVVSVSPYAFNNSGAGTVTVIVTGWPGANVCLYIDTDTTCHPYVITPDGTLTVSIPMGEFSAMTEGLHYITAVQYDSSGNPSAISSQANFFIDNQPPVLTFENPVPSGSDVSAYVFINLVVNDPSPSSIVDSDSLVITLDTIPVDTSNFLVTPFSIVGAIDNVLDGPYTIRASICDNARNCSAVASRDFNVGDPVSITSITPNPTSVASTITIYGTGFDATAPENNLVVFGGGIWTYPTTVASSSQMQVMVPEGAITEGVRVGVEPYLSDPYNLTIRPSLTSVFPQIVSRGQNITIEGTGFSGNLSDNKVRFCTNVGCSTYNDLTPSDGSPTHLQITVPTNSAQAVSGPLSVLVSGVVSINSIPVLIATPDNNEVPEDYFGNDTVLAVGKTGIGTIVDPAYLEEKDMYVFEGTAGTRITINLSAIDQYGQVKPGGNNPDTLLELFDVRGYYIGFNDDINYPSNLNSRMSLVLPETGTYVLRVSAYNPGFYNLQIIAEPSTLSSLGQIVPAIHAPGQMIALQGSGFNSVLSNNTIAFSRCTHSSAPSCHCTISGATYTAPISGNTTSLNIIVPSIPDGAGCQDGDWAYVYVHNGSNWSNSIPFTWFIDATNTANTALEKELGPTPIDVISSNALVPGSAVNQMGASDRDLYVFTGNAGDIIRFDKDDILSSGVTVNLLLRSPEGEIIFDGYPIPWVKLSQNGQYSVEVEAINPNLQGTYRLRSFRVTGNVPARLSMYSGGPNGNHRITTVGSAFADPLIVQVTDSTNAPVQNVAVEWSVGGTILGYGLTTALGTSGINFPFTPTSPGLYTVEARVVGLSSAIVNRPGASLVFELLTLAPGSGSSVASVFPIFGDFGTSDNHMKKVEDTLTDEFCVLAVDSLARPVSGQGVNWAVSGGGFISDQDTVTDAYGMACFSSWTMGSCTNNISCTISPTSSYELYSEPYYTLSGINIATATIGGSPVNFYAFSLPLVPHTINFVVGQNQTQREGQQLADPVKVKILDVNNNPVSNAEVNFSLDPVNPTDGDVSGMYLPTEEELEGGFLNKTLLRGDIELEFLPITTIADISGTTGVYWVAGISYAPAPLSQTMTVSCDPAVQGTATTTLLNPKNDDGLDGKLDGVSHYISWTSSVSNNTYGGLINHPLPDDLNIAAFEYIDGLAHSYLRSPDVVLSTVSPTSNITIAASDSGQFKTRTNGYVLSRATMGNDVGLAELTIHGVWPDGSYYTTPTHPYEAHKATTFRICPGTPSDQYINVGESFSSICFELLDESDNGVPKVAINSYIYLMPGFFIGGIPKNIGSTDYNGRVFVQQPFGRYDVGGGFFGFYIEDDTISKTLAKVYDERGEIIGWKDRNEVPYKLDYCPDPFFIQGEFLRTRLVRVHLDSRPVVVNVYLSSNFETAINKTRAALFESGQVSEAALFTKVNIVDRTLQILNEYMTSSGISGVTFINGTQKSADPSHFNILIGHNDGVYVSLYITGFQIEPFFVGLTSEIEFDTVSDRSTNQSAINAYHAIFSKRFDRSSDIFKKYGYPSVEKTSRFLAHNSIHELGHQFGLVHLNLFGRRRYSIFDAGEWHNRPYLRDIYARGFCGEGELCQQWCSIMDQYCNLSAIESFSSTYREINALFIKTKYGLP